MYFSLLYTGCREALRLFLTTYMNAYIHTYIVCMYVHFHNFNLLLYLTFERTMNEVNSHKVTADTRSNQ